MVREVSSWATRSRPERFNLSQASSRACRGSQPCGTVQPTPAVRPRSRIKRPIPSPAVINPPGEWKKSGSLRPPSFFSNARRRPSAPGSKVPSAAIHSWHPGPHAFGSPLGRKKTMGGGSEADLVWGGLVWVGLVWVGLVWVGLVSVGLVWVESGLPDAEAIDGPADAAAGRPSTARRKRRGKGMGGGRARLG